MENGSVLLVGSRAAEDVLHRVIPLMTGILNMPYSGCDFSGNATVHGRVHVIGSETVA
jgi:hypothetical protein